MGALPAGEFPRRYWPTCWLSHGASPASGLTPVRAHMLASTVGHDGPSMSDHWPPVRSGPAPDEPWLYGGGGKPELAYQMLPVSERLSPKNTMSPTLAA